VEIKDFFHGSALNAVDAKGRVSVPSTFRSVIERRSHRALMPGEFPSKDKIILIGEHERLPCLQAFDPSYSHMLFENVAGRVDAMGEGVDRMNALDDAQLDVFGAANEYSYDDAGRMVLPPLLRMIAGIEGLAYFVGGGATFQIWNPERFLEHCADKPRLARTLQFLLAERAGKA
jgi:MraZ protein